MLLLERYGESVGHVALERLYGLLDGKPLEDEMASSVVHAILPTLRSSKQRDVQLMAAKCLGRIGAIDPGRLNHPTNIVGDNQSSHANIFIDDEQKVFVNSVLLYSPQFYADVFTRCWKVYSNLVDPQQVDSVEFTIQSLFHCLSSFTDCTLLINRCVYTSLFTISIQSHRSMPA